MNKNYGNVLIVTDIDGTYLDSKSRVVERNDTAIKRFTDAGGFFTFATGRYESMLGEAVPGYEKLINAPGIFCNGAYIYDTTEHKIIDGQFIDGKYTLGVINAVRKKFPEIIIRYTCGQGIIYPHEHKETDLPLGEWYKVIFIGKSDVLDAAREFMISLTGDRFVFSKSSSELLELLDAGATKGTMMLRLKKYLSQRGHDVTAYAIGDYENDIDMLRRADVAVCPSNALQSVKDSSKIQVCSCDEGALADLINIIMN